MQWKLTCLQQTNAMETDMPKAKQYNFNAKCTEEKCGSNTFTDKPRCRFSTIYVIVLRQNSPMYDN